MTMDMVRMDDGVVDIDWSRLLQTPIENLSQEEVVVALSLVDVTKKALADREKALKAAAVPIVTERGVVKTAKTKRFGGGEAQVEVTQKADTLTVDVPKLRAVMTRTGVAEGDIFDRLPVLNNKKLEAAIVIGVFNEEQVAEFTSKKANSPAVSVKSVVFGVTKAKLLGG